MRIIAAISWLTLIQLSNTSTPLAYNADIDDGRQGSYPVQKFITSKIQAPHVNFKQQSPECDDGQYYFITPKGHKVKQPGPMILDNNGDVIWSHHFTNEFGGQAYDLRVQNYTGETYLTFWLGDDRIRGHGAGHYYMLNSSYDVAHKIGAANNKYADLHEFNITPEGTALLIIFEPIKADVRPVGRTFPDLWNQAAWDCLFQAVNITSGDLIFEWRASEHLNLTLAYNRIKTNDQGTKEQPFDFVHLNSVEKDELGNYLVSSRSMHAIMYISGQTKEILWTLGGKNNNFQDLSDGHVLNMAWQHDARFVPVDAFPETYHKPKKAGMTTRLMTVFDNAALDWNYEYGPPYSRGLLLEVSYPIPKKVEARGLFSGDNGGHDHPIQDRKPYISEEPLSKQDAEKVASINGTSKVHTVRIIREYINPDHVRSSTQGSVQLLPQAEGKDPRVLVGYGINAVITEFHSNGSVACDFHFGARSSWETGDVQSYRAYKSPWVGKPKDPPSAIVRKGKVFVSWNGATEVKEWVLQRKKEDGDWEEVTRVPKTGFEISIPLKTDKYDVSQGKLGIVAMDKNGTVCENGMADLVVQRGLAEKVTQHLAANDMPSMTFGLVLFGSATSMYLLWRWRASRRSRVVQSHHID